MLVGVVAVCLPISTELGPRTWYQKWHRFTLTIRVKLGLIRSRATTYFAATILCLRHGPLNTAATTCTLPSTQVAPSLLHTSVKVVLSNQRRAFVQTLLIAKALRSDRDVLVLV